MQRFWSVISTTLLIEYHWIPLNNIHQVCIKRFDSRAIFLRQCNFLKVLLFPPASRLEATAIFSSDGVPLNQLCWQKHNCPHYWDSATKLRNECLGFIHIVFLFKVRATAFVNTMGRRQTKNSRCFKPAYGGKSSTFWKWHCLRKIALESKRLIHTWWTWCQITWKRIFYPIQ